MLQMARYWKRELTAKAARGRQLSLGSKLGQGSAHFASRRRPTAGICCCATGLRAVGIDSEDGASSAGANPRSALMHMGARRLHSLRGDVGSSGGGCWRGGGRRGQWGGHISSRLGGGVGGGRQLRRHIDR